MKVLLDSSNDLLLSFVCLESHLQVALHVAKNALKTLEGFFFAMNIVVTTKKI